MCRLSSAQRERLKNEGYLHLPGITPPELRDAALKAINASLGENGLDPALLTRFRSQSYTPELQGDACVTDLYNASPLRAIAESLIGAIRPVTRAQVALRFPAAGPPREPKPHIDGTHSPTNGVLEGTFASFTALAGVFLSDVAGDYCGNFTVWPGSHLLLQEYCLKNDPQSVTPGLPLLDLAAPVQLKVNAGDAILAHHMLAHSAAGNSSANVRYAAFFRLSHPEHADSKWECLRNPWLHWPGLAPD
ncbi:MAG TPA: phytanoyl-CoA dioxygenase family protein [Chthonomonadales bacterium]|nr:phytanoyl-CoA dioxygenase family protein [Chthonomonadales bacterium]